MTMRSPWLPSLWNERKGDIDPFRLLRSQLDDLFQDFTGGMSRLSALPEGTFPLRVDVCETPEALTIKADLPGVDQKDVDVSLTGDEITISAEKKSETADENGGKDRIFHRTERTYGAFQRTMTVPFDVDPSAVEATFTNGVLTVKLPKPPEAKREAKKVEVKSGS